MRTENAQRTPRFGQEADTERTGPFRVGTRTGQRWPRFGQRTPTKRTRSFRPGQESDRKGHKSPTNRTDNGQAFSWLRHDSDSSGHRTGRERTRIATERTGSGQAPRHRAPSPRFPRCRSRRLHRAALPLRPPSGAARVVEGAAAADPGSAVHCAQCADSPRSSRGGHPLPLLPAVWSTEHLPPLPLWSMLGLVQQSPALPLRLLARGGRVQCVSEPHPGGAPACGAPRAAPWSWPAACSTETRRGARLRGERSQSPRTEQSCPLPRRDATAARPHRRIASMEPRSAWRGSPRAARVVSPDGTKVYTQRVKRTTVREGSSRHVAGHGCAPASGPVACDSW